MKIKGRSIIGFCLWIGVFYVLFLYQKSCSYEHSFSSNFIVALCHVFCLSGCATIMNKLVSLLYKRRFLLFACSLLGLIFITTKFMQLLERTWYVYSGKLDEKGLVFLEDFSFQFFTGYLVVIICCICTIGFRLFSDQLAAETRYAQLQKEKAQTELNFLKAQINPHFLFNSINSIFAHIDKSNVVARNIVLQFSNILRYQLYECTAETICFEKELSYLHNYIELQRLRKGDNLSVVVETEGKMQSFKLAPLLIVPFVENAFKFVSNYDDKPNKIKISISKNTNTFNFSCYNTRESIISPDLFNEGGIGINNVKRRLELIYQDRHNLVICETEHSFDINLKIELL